MLKIIAFLYKCFLSCTSSDHTNGNHSRPERARLSRRDAETMNAARLTCRVCVPARVPLATQVVRPRVHGRSFFKRVFSSACARRDARELYSSLCPVIHLRACWSFFSNSAGGSERKRERVRERREKGKEGVRKRGKSKVGFRQRRCLNQPRASRTRQFYCFDDGTKKRQNNNVARYVRHSFYFV